MTVKSSSIHLVDDPTLERYPISSHDRLDSHYFVVWNLKRWRGSDFRKAAYKDPEVGWFGMELFFLSQDETPVGTLPCDDESLAFLLRMTVARWKDLASRAESPLHGWYKVLCDNGKVRFAHPVVKDVAVEALDSKRRNSAKNADDRMRKRLGTIAQHLLKSIPGGGRIAESEEQLNAISDWIDGAYPGGSATQKRVREALNAIFQRP